MKTEPSSEAQGLPASGSGLLSLLSKDWNASPDLGSNPASARGMWVPSLRVSFTICQGGLSGS